MAKSSKKSKENAVPEGKPAAPNGAADNRDSTAHPEKPVFAKSATPKTVKPATGAKSAIKNRQKTTVARKRRPATPQKNSGAGKVMISEEDIRLRAYFISEGRLQNGIPGDSAHDWLEAQRQLQKEAQKRA
jgi:hypothetical protein